MRSVLLCALVAGFIGTATLSADEPTAYPNRLVPIAKPRPIFADYPDYVEPLAATTRFETT